MSHANLPPAEPTLYKHAENVISCKDKYLNNIGVLKQCFRKRIDNGHVLKYQVLKTRKMCAQFTLATYANILPHLPVADKGNPIEKKLSSTELPCFTTANFIISTTNGQQSKKYHHFFPSFQQTDMTVHYSKEQKDYLDYYCKRSSEQLHLAVSQTQNAEDIQVTITSSSHRITLAFLVSSG